MGGKFLHKELSYKVRGILFEVHNTLGPYRKEQQYCDAIEYGLRERGVSYEREKVLPESFVGEHEGRNRVDFIVENAIIIEAKAVPVFMKSDYARCLRYLVSSNADIAFLVNFGGRFCVIKRIPSPKLIIPRKTQYLYIRVICKSVCLIY